MSYSHMKGFFIQVSAMPLFELWCNYWNSHVSSSNWLLMIHRKLLADCWAGSADVWMTGVCAKKKLEADWPVWRAAVPWMLLLDEWQTGWIISGSDPLDWHEDYHGLVCETPLRLQHGLAVNLLPSGSWLQMLWLYFHSSHQTISQLRA